MGRASSPSIGSLPVGANGKTIPSLPSGAGQLINLTGGDTDEINSVDFGSEVKVISIVAIGGAIHHKVGDSGVVASNTGFPIDPYLPENKRRHIPVFDDNDRISVIRAVGVSATVDVYITEHAR